MGANSFVGSGKGRGGGYILKWAGRGGQGIHGEEDNRPARSKEPLDQDSSHWVDVPTLRTTGREEN